MELKAKAKFTNVLKAKAVFERVNVVSGDITATNTALDAVNEEVIGTTPAEKIDYVDAWKADIKAAIEDKGVDMTGVIPVEYADKIAEISGSATGDAVASEVLAGKTFSNETATGLTGTMPNRGAVSITPGTSAQTIEAGYHNGAGAVAGDADLIAGNIKKDTVIFGVTGTLEAGIAATGNATVDQVLSGATFSNADNIDLTGTMPNRGAVNITPSTTAQTIAAGYHNGSGSVAGDADLAAGNIKTGVNIFGVAGNVIQATGDAVAANVLTGKTFSNAGAAGVSGTMPNIGAQNITPSASNQSISAGYHNGSGVVAGDADLVTGNIRAGATIFGVAGKTEVVDTSSGDAVAGDLLNDKKVWVDGAEITGTRPPCPVPWTGVAGDSGVAWPDPRFVDNGDNTITDMLTGLMWLKNSNPNGNATWANQITYCADLTTGGHTDWRMPNIKEFVTLLDYSPVSTKLPAGHPFTNASTQVFHLDAEMPHSTTNSMTATLQYGSLSGEAKTQSRAVWPVRGPIAL